MLRKIWVPTGKGTPLENIDFTLEETGGFVPSQAINDSIKRSGLEPTPEMDDLFLRNCAKRGLCELVTLQ